ncbi:MAG: arginine--tRNA ligase [Fretibacterium sp.]|nr:arginine--tRNA ligase [Fretibacterium sp.]
MSDNVLRTSAVSYPKEALVRAVRSVAEKMGKNVPEGMAFELERPRHEGQGDRAASAAMQLAKVFGVAPRELAGRIVERLQEDESGFIERLEVAGPGFVNFFLSRKWFAAVAEEVLSRGERYGALDLGEGRRVQVEFVSANPTGPLHIGHGRGAAVGDVVANILAFTGWNVEREYYINDAGLQMEMLGRSTQARYFELLGRPETVPFPENGYRGAYIVDLARAVLDSEGERFLAETPADSLPWFKRYAGGVILGQIEEDLRNFGVSFDVWFSEASLYERDLVRLAMEDLKKRDYAFESEGALWFKTTDFEDDKDRVLIRNNGAPTYFASDIAYHRDKFVTRGFDRVIDVWGADHHGYIPRIKAGVGAIGKSPDDLDVLLIQLVNLMRDGQPVAMSTRSGEFVTLKEVLEEVGVDATRFFFLMRRSDSQLDFDLDLAKRQSSDNPVYYVQYAHARICSIVREWEARGGRADRLRAEGASVPEELFEDGAARALADCLALFPREVENASRDLAPQMLTGYAGLLAGAFHSFYNTNRILGEPEDVELGRLRVAEAVRVVLHTCLGLLGVSAPERM